MKYCLDSKPFLPPSYMFSPDLAAPDLVPGWLVCSIGAWRGYQSPRAGAVLPSGRASQDWETGWLFFCFSAPMRRVLRRNGLRGLLVALDEAWRKILLGIKERTVLGSQRLPVCNFWASPCSIVMCITNSLPPHTHSFPVPRAQSCSRMASDAWSRSSSCSSLQSLDVGAGVGGQAFSGTPSDFSDDHKLPQSSRTRGSG
jgi:hypothetical protein